MAPREHDEYATERERLRAALLRLRDNAAPAAQQIARELPELTVHDVSHADALWSISDEIVGDSITLNPVEAFVLGAAFYTHDLSLGLAGLQTDGRYLQELIDGVVAAREFQRLGRWPTDAELAHVDDAERSTARLEVLRLAHAERAEELLRLPIRSPQGGSDLYLLDDQDLRMRYAGMIGLIAHSHGWPVDRLRDEFDAKRGGPGWAPQWGVDRLLVACVLRLADAANVDERRAPALLQAVSLPISEEAGVHWSFQRRLQPANGVGDRLEFSSAEAFPAEEAAAWWLCYETLSMVDRELRRVDALLSDLGRPRLAARSVAGIDAPERFTEYVAVDGWNPIDARVHVSDVAKLVRQLGGEELYGGDPSVPLRELIQNGADAVRARRLCEEREANYGHVAVRLGKDSEDEPWIEVEDDGLGMSLDVLQGYLLSFGASFWTSPRLPYEFPLLARKRFVPTGRYGIGFFSVFMWGDRVQVTTRAFNLGQAETTVLEFGSGPAERPIVRVARQHERLRDGGTRVRVWLTHEVLAAMLKLPPDSAEEQSDTPLAPRLRDLVSYLAPALDVDVSVEADGEQLEAVAAGDWVSLPIDELSARMGNGEREGFSSKLEAELVEGEDGEVLGRGCLSHQRYGSPGVVTVGGLRATSVSSFEGVLIARPIRAARDLAYPLASAAAMAAWATRQAEQASAARLPSAELLRVSQCVRSLGGNVRGLPVAECRSGTLSFDEVVGWIHEQTAFRVAQDAQISMLSREAESFELLEDVLSVAMTIEIMIQFQHGKKFVSWPAALEGESGSGDHESRTMFGVVLEAAAEAWEVDQEALVIDGFGYTKTAIAMRDSKSAFGATSAVLRPGTPEATLVTRRNRARELLSTGEMVTTAQLASELEVSERTVSSILAPQVKAGMIKKVKGGYRSA